MGKKANKKASRALKRAAFEARLDNDHGTSTTSEQGLPTKKRTKTDDCKGDEEDSKPDDCAVDDDGMMKVS